MRILSIVVFVLATAALLLPAPHAHAGPRFGTIRVETENATPHDRVLLEKVARNLEQYESLWKDPPRGIKTFRVMLTTIHSVTCSR